MRTKLLIAVAALAMISTPAFAEITDIFSVGYVDLTHSYTSATGRFHIVHDSSSSGDAQRLVPTEGVTNFDFGAGNIGSAAVDFDIIVSGIAGNQAVANGTFSFTDIDGDTITGNLTGVFLRIGDDTFLNATVDEVWFSGSTFDGTDGASVSTVFHPPFHENPYIGAVVNLTTLAPWFSGGDFTDGTTGGATTIQAVPVPGAAALGALGLGLVGWMKRRWS